MKYSALMNAVDPIKALALLDMEAKPNGSWIKFPCSCGKEAVLKAHGEKKNVWYCPECKDKGHIISLTMARKTISYEEATKLLEAKAVVPSQGKVKEELKLTLKLEYHSKLEEHGISEETAALLEIGQAKGRNVLAGHIAFRVEDEEGMKIAYYGLHLETGKPKFFFNPELYLYRWNFIDKEQAVFFTPDIYECVRQVQGGNQAVCNFALPYLSEAHLEMLSQCSTAIFSPKISDEIIYQAPRRLEVPLVFLKGEDNG